MGLNKHKAAGIGRGNIVSIFWGVSVIMAVGGLINQAFDVAAFTAIITCLTVQSYAMLKKIENEDVAKTQAGWTPPEVGNADPR